MLTTKNILFIPYYNMQVSRSNLYNYSTNNLSVIQYNARRPISAPYNVDNVSFKGIKLPEICRFNKTVQSGMSKFKTFSMQEYKKLSYWEKVALRLKYKILNFKNYKEAKTSEFIHSHAAEEIKNSLDKKYGTNKYSVVVIGRSISSIGKVLSYKIGEDNVYNIPMSNAQRFLISDNVKSEDLYNLKKYIESIGLSKKIKDSSNKIIIMDYCITGSSLKGANSLFKDYLYKNNKNINKENVTNLINDIRLRMNCKYLFLINKYKNLSFVEKCKNLNQISSSLVEPQKKSEKTKLTWFKLLDNEMSNKKPDKKNTYDYSDKIPVELTTFIRSDKTLL